MGARWDDGLGCPGTDIQLSVMRWRPMPPGAYSTFTSIQATGQLPK